MGNGDKAGDLQSAASRFWSELTRRQLPDNDDNTVAVSNNSVQVGTIVAEDKLNDAILKENAVQTSSSPVVPSAPSAAAPVVQSTPQPAVQPTPEPAVQPTPEPTVQPTPEPVSYTVKRGDTLIGICIQKYGSDARVAEVCSLNNIKNPDSIKIGQKILLP